MRYPSLIYFPPHTKPPSLGKNLEHLLMPELDELVGEVTGHLVNETNGGDNYPNFHIFSGDSWSALFDDVTDLGAKYIYVLSDKLPRNFTQQVVLDFVGIDSVYVRIFDSAKKDLNMVSTSSSFTLVAA